MLRIIANILDQFNEMISCKNKLECFSAKYIICRHGETCKSYTNIS
jgi:hypothetical protein